MSRMPSIRGLSLIVAIIFSGVCQSQSAAPEKAASVPGRETIVARIADLRHIATPEGIEVLEPVQIGGSTQWISIRGLNKANPVLLMIHGGPGSPTMATSWAFQTPWEDYFTVVQWDQRGVGKNYAGADHQALAKTMTVERNVKDGEEMVAYLRKRLQKDKIVVLGFSWGTAIGTMIAQRHPEWLYAYVGVGQSVNDKAEAYIYTRTLELAEKAGNAEAVKELRSLTPYPPVSGDGQEFIRKALAIRKWVRVYNGGWYGKSNFDLYFALPQWGPEYTQADVDNVMPGMQWAESALAQDLSSTSGDLEKTATDFKVPIIFMMGRYDLHTPYVSAKQYFARIHAPMKKFITFERSSHFVMFEEPGRFLVTLVNDVLPLTGPPVMFKPLD